MRLFLLSIAAFVIYYLLYTQVFGFITPRTHRLRQEAVSLKADMELLKARMSDAYEQLEELSERDNNVYRPIFGMSSISIVDRTFGTSGMDMLYNMAYMQSVSFDTIAPVAENAGKMAACVPSIPPVNLAHVRLTSRFGVRSDPMNGTAKMHSGIDLAGPSGEPIYVTGDGRVDEVNFNFFGYGNVVVVNHGFGYRTRYAHLKSAAVHVGDYVQRGDLIAYMGSSGKSTGTHLHYEVEYMGRKVNPLNYFNSKISPEEYERLVSGK